MKVRVRIQTPTGVLFDDTVEAPSTCNAITRVLMDQAAPEREIAARLHGRGAGLKVEAGMVSERPGLGGKERA